MLLGGTANNAWATDVTYHILTLPINPSVYDYKMKSAITGWRLEAVKVVEKGQSTLELPAHYKSPLATGFKYYKAADVSKYNSGAAQNLFDNGPIKGVLYKINGEDTPTTADDPTPVAEGTTLSENTAEYYVVYTYNASNTIAQLDGSVRYNIGFKNKGFLSYNRGRNNRPAVVPKGKVDPAMLASEDFMKVDVTGSGITAYWSHGDNKNNVEITGSNFHFMFKFEGYDPYNIIIRTAYDRDLTYIEKNDNTSDFVYKYYKEGSFFTNGTAKGYIASDEHRHYNMPYNSSLSENPTNLVEGAAGDHTGYDAMTGYYHGQNATMWNSFALLNNSGNSGYVFMGTRTVNGSGTIPGPTNDGKYYYLKAENNDLFIVQLTLSDVTKNYSTEGIYPIKKVTFKVATPFYSVDPSENHIVSVADWVSQYTVEKDPIKTQYLPEVLKRKYCSFREKFYKDPECTQEITYFYQANYDNTEGYKVYLAYDVSESVPFKAITPSDSYTADTWRAATWYELTDKDETTDKKIKYDGTTYFKNNGATTTYEKVSEYAFIGDPYELHVILRSETSGATPSYLGATGANPASGTALTTSTDATAGYKWEIPMDNTVGSMLLRKFNDEGHWYWDTAESNQSVTYSTESSTRVKVLTLPERDFTYNIVDKAGNIAVQATISQTIFSSLNGYASIPEVIRSPFLSDETVTFYSSYSGGGRRNLSSLITELTEGNPASSTNVYVKYTTEHLNSKSIHLNAEDPNQQFNVKLNGSYIYYDSGSNKIMSNASATTEQLATDPYLWFLRNRDPYAMLIDNIAARTDLSVSGKENVTVYNDDGDSVQDDGTTPATLNPDTRPLRDKGAWVRVDGGSWGNDKALVFTSTRTDASRFIAMMSKNIGVYEVMAATGDETYYHIGRATGTDTDTKIYSVSTAGFAHGDNALRFELFGKVPITYTLIDKAGNELLDVSSNNPRLTLPAEFVSPLVETYYYYPTKAKAISALTANKVDPESGDAITEIDSDTQEDDATPGDSHVWVTYKVNNLVDFNDNNSSYLLKFLHPFDAGYYLEDGNDKLTTEKIQAVYPYTNGDGSLNIYGQKMNEEQMGGGAATRPRWVWFFESDNDDPYHVKIHSKSTISFNSVSHPTYLQTYAVHFRQDANEKKQRIVNGGALPGIASVEPTEYMILGTAGKYQLMTTNPVKADLNGDGDTDDTVDGVSENARRSVTSFEQYWKTYNMVKLHVLGISKSTDAFSNVESTWVVPTADDPATLADESTYRTTIEARGWHSYDVIANATRWNGYNDKSDGGHEKKVVEKLEHWFQTFDMGDGEFAIESAVIPPVLVLLDRHGWEIMRQPLPPVSTYPNGDDQLKALRVFDSPMVDKYYFYSNATKASGCHKYTLRMQDGKERDQIKVDGEHYSSTSLGSLPPKTATGVLSGGAIQDFYVTYTVKEEYEKSFKYELDYTEIKEGDKVTGYTINSETGTPSKFVIVQNGRYARKEINEEKSYLSKPVPQATNPTGGNVYDMILNPSQVTVGNIIVDTNTDGIIDDDNLWYVQPNLNIDNEMGIVWGTAISGAEPLSEVATKVAYKDKTGFDPYNLQLKNALSDNRFYTSAISSTRLHNGIWEGTLGSAGIELKTATTSGYVTPEGYDHTILQITNQTFMAVSDANGNMQLMPRFDHTKRINVTSGGSSRTTLQDPVDHDLAVVTDNASMGPQTVFMVRPRKFEYHIIDHDGKEALRYKTAGEYSPSIPNRYKSPLATDFKYYYGTTEKVISDAGDYATQWANAEEIYKRTALTDELVTSQADYLPDTGDYYFRIGTDPASYTYKKVTVTKVKEINQLFADAGLNAGVNQVYVRYSFDEEATDNEILRGKWFTINLANKDVQSSGAIVTTVGASQGTGVDLYSGSKPGTIDGDVDNRKWQWKFLASPTDISSPYYRPIDPYAIQIFNRSANYSDNLAAEPNPMSIGIKVPNNASGADRFALLLHPNQGYALVAAGLGLDTYSYSYLNGADMTTPSAEPKVAASIVEECYQKSINIDDYATLKTTLASGPNAVYYVKLNRKEVDEKPDYYKVTVTSSDVEEETSNATEWEKSYISIGAQLVFNNDVTHTYTYHVINNGHKLAVSGTQTNDEAASHNLTPYTPEGIQTPLLNEDDYKYYGSVIINKNETPDDPSDDTYTVVDATKLFTLYGLYDDVAYVRYEDYDMDKTEYLVPNKRNTPGTTVARDPESQDVALNIKGELPYNIIWESDNMMKKGDGDAIGSDPNKELDGDGKYVWLFEGEDPYALKIKHKAGNNYVNGTGTLGSAKEFMLLRKSGYDYGILQETGGNNMLSGCGNELVGSNPTKFIIFGLSTHKVIYHLVINTTNENTTIPYRTGTESSPGSLEEKDIPGTTQRDLTSSIFGVPGDRYQLGTTFMGQTYCVDAGEVSIGDVLEVPNEFSRPNCLYFFYVDNVQTKGDTDHKITKTSESEMNTSAASLEAVGDYYYKIENQYIYRKIHVTEVSPVAYEISASTESEWSSLTAADEAAMITAADALAETGDYYYKVGPLDIYKRVQVTTAKVGETPAVYSVVDCSQDDWSNAWQDNETLNGKYKGLEITKLMSDAGLIGGLVKINIAYAFETGLETNAGEGFVTSVGQNLWYTFETENGTTPYLAHYTNAWGLQAMAGRDTRYTNDYLWTPLGDVYGFKMYNRYMIKNSGGVANVMTMPSITEGTNLKMAVPGSDGIPLGNEVFELLSPSVVSSGYFKIHPVVNKIGTQYYIRKDPADNYAKISSTNSEWTFNLPSDLLKPYIERKGYVGGLTEDAYSTNKTVLDKVMNGTASYADMLTIQGIVYNDANIVSYTPGYYRLHSQPGVSGISPVRYASGYLHDIEKTDISGGIPMHFYSKAGVTTTFSGLKSGFTVTNATRGEIPVPATEYDPSSVFYFNGNTILDGNPRSTMQTQGLYVAANPMGDTTGGENEKDGKGTNRLQRAVMVAPNNDNSLPSNVITFSLMDIGGAVLLIHDGAVPAQRRYLNFDQSNTFQKTAMDDTDMTTQAAKFTSKGTYYFKIGESSYTYKKITVTSGYVAGPPATNAVCGDAESSTIEEWNKAADIYDLKYYHDSPTDDAKWCMEPANNKGLQVAVNNGGDDYYYATFCAPYDVKLPDNDGTKTYYAYTCDKWDDKNLLPKKVPAVTGSPSYDEGKFVPAGTSVIFRIKDESGNMKLTIEGNGPSSPSDDNIFLGTYLEQLLIADASHDVYTLGLPFTTPVTIDRSTGAITAELPEKANSGLGFYINATQNKENAALQSLWLRNNRYVQHNKLYYRASASPAREMTRGVEFVPVIFDDDEGDPEQNGVTEQRVGDGCVYDLLGRKVATEQQAKDGTWRQYVAPGIYIVHGKKVKR